MTDKLTDSLERQLTLAELERRQTEPLISVRKLFKSLVDIAFAIAAGVRSARPTAAKGNW